jgi:mRNA interferase MazF
MTDCNPGDVVLVRLPFTDLTSTKRRPAVIISNFDFPRKYGDLVVMPLTSQRQSDARLELRDWRTAGLLKPTWAKPAIATISFGLVQRVLGSISENDRAAVRAAIKAILSDSFLAV